MAKDNFSYQDFLLYKNVSRETFLRLELYVELLSKWQKTINLISSTTVSEIWKRHIIDSAQLFDYIQLEDKVLDVGSGAGFPGLILAILGIRSMTLVEKDSRKAAFLREAARMTEITDINIVNQRVEDSSLSDFTLVTARAFAPVKDVLESLKSKLNTSHKLLLLKGKNCISELEDARKYWTFESQIYPSITDSTGAILSLHKCHKLGAIK